MFPFGLGFNPEADAIFRLLNEWFMEADLRAAWAHAEVRDMLSRVIRSGMLRHDPSLASDFLAELQQLCENSALSNDERLDRLYDFLHSPTNGSRFQTRFGDDETARIQRRVEQFLALIPQAPSVYVDVGCGTGRVTAGLARAWSLPPERAFGVEVFERSQVADVFTPLAFEGRRIPLHDNFADLATLVMVLHHETDPVGLLREVHRILKPNSILLIRESDVDNDALRLFNQVLDRMYLRVFNRLPDVPDPALHRSAREWESLLVETGFEVRELHRPEPGNPFTPIHLLCLCHKQPAGV